MALLIIPIGMLVGWFVRPPIRAAWATTAVGVGALAVLAVLWMSGVEVSPLETLVLIICTPLAALLALKIAGRRRSRE